MNNPSILKALALGVAVTAAALTAASAQTTTNPIYITTNDFGQFNGGGTNAVVSSSFFSVNNTTNGVGNSSSAGGTGTAGSFQFISQNGYGTVSGGSFTGPTAAAFTALSPGSLRPYSPESGFGPGTMVAGSGTMTFDVDTANLIGYSYYTFGFNLNYDNNYSTFFPSSSSNFTGADGNTWTHYVIPYTTAAHSLNYFGWALAENSGGGPGGETVYVDNFQIASTVAVPEPSTIALLVMGGLGAVIMIRRRRIEA